MLELSRQIAAYKRMQPDLEMDHFGKWALFYDEVFVGTYDTEHEAVGTAIEKFGRGPYLIRQIGVKPVPPLGSLIYGNEL